MYFWLAQLPRLAQQVGSGSHQQLLGAGPCDRSSFWGYEPWYFIGGDGKKILIAALSPLNPQYNACPTSFLGLLKVFFPDGQPTIW